MSELGFVPSLFTFVRESERGTRYLFGRELRERVREGTLCMRLCVEGTVRKREDVCTYYVRERKREREEA